MSEIRYYKADISHYCSFKLILSNSEDAAKIVRHWICEQNRGECKSDRLILKKVWRVSEKEYNECNWDVYYLTNISIK